jgi:hypothetical protein
LDLEHLIRSAIPICREAGRLCPRTGPGRKPECYEDWEIAVMILCGVIKKKKSKSAQYRLICLPDNAAMLKRLLKLERLPCRSNFFARYQRVWPVVQKAIELQGRVALKEHVADAKLVAIDKSLMHARGPEWNQKDRKHDVVPNGLRGVDRQADWGMSDYHGWVYGYSFEVMVAATKDSVVLPLLASVDTASTNEHTSVVAKLDHLPASTRTVLVDPGYDSNDLADRVELDDRDERPTRPRRRWVCPPQKGFVSQIPEKGRRERQRRRRVRRLAFLRSGRGRKLYARRKQTVEPFNGRFKAMFELDDHVWHRGLDNNRTLELTAMFAYQLLVRLHWKRGGRNAQVQYILDAL